MKKASEFAEKLAATAKSVVKIALQSKAVGQPKKNNDTSDTLIILANGPSLRGTIDKSLTVLKHHTTMAVNFAANSPEFFEIKPKYYILADPHFFKATGDENVSRLISNLKKADWQMTLFVDRRHTADYRQLIGNDGKISIKGLNLVAAEGFEWFERTVYRLNIAMPHPRNVLIPAIMTGVRLGYKTIYICGADHTWMHDLIVTDENEVVSALNHYYKEAETEVTRSRNEYKGYRLHEIIKSYYIAFKAYHQIQSYASRYGVKIINATPGSYIDAFERSKLPE